MKTVGLVFPTDNTFRCEKCGKEYKSEAAFLKHIKEKHSDEE